MAEAEKTIEKAAKTLRRTEIGVVVSDKMDKTIVVKTREFEKHKKYHKYIKRDITFYAHDEKGEAKEGDRVEIMETRPLSKLKRWRLLRVLGKAGG